MQKALLYKFVTISLLMLALLIPLKMISNVIQERWQYRLQAHNQIEQGWPAGQRITGAMIAVPYLETITREEETTVNNVLQKTTKKYVLHKTKYILPDVYKVEGKIATEERYRGIYAFPVYTAALDIKGLFTLPKLLGIDVNLENIVFEKPSLILGVSGVRGIQRTVAAEIDGSKQTFLPGTGSTIFPNGVHAVLNMENFDTEKQLSFHINLDVQGMDSFSLIPVGKDTTVTLQSPWPHPSFSGFSLPKTRDVSEKGFEALWETSFFATNMPDLLDACHSPNDCNPWNSSAFGVDLQNGVDVYLKSERSIKYAILFVGLTFVAFFLFEVLKGVRIHAVQYSLVGFALALFYLLLISLSEHISFVLAYITATSACVGLLGFYVSYILHSFLRSAVFSSALTGLYGALYVLMGSEDYALLLGSCLIFVCTALVMFATRHVDWHQVGRLTKESATAE